MSESQEQQLSQQAQPAAQESSALDSAALDSADWDDVSFLDDMQLGDIDPESYQEQEDDGCEGGACKI